MRPLWTPVAVNSFLDTFKTVNLYPRQKGTEIMQPIFFQTLCSLPSSIRLEPKPQLKPSPNRGTPAGCLKPLQALLNWSQFSHQNPGVSMRKMLCNFRLEYFLFGKFRNKLQVPSPRKFAEVVHPGGPRRTPTR